MMYAALFGGFETLPFSCGSKPSEKWVLRVRSENFSRACHSGHLREALCRFQTVMESIPF